MRGTGARRRCRGAAWEPGCAVPRARSRPGRLLGGVAALAGFVLWERRTSGPHAAPRHLRLAPVHRRPTWSPSWSTGPSAARCSSCPSSSSRVVGYTPLASGVALVPVSADHAAAVGKVGPPGLPDRAAAAHDPRAAARGRRVALFTRIGPGASYLAEILPASLVYGFGLVLTVAPLTSTVLAAAPAEARRDRLGGQQRRRPDGRAAGRGRPAGGGRHLGADALEPAVFAAGFRTAMTIAAVLCAAGGGAVLVRHPKSRTRAGAGAGGATTPSAALSALPSPAGRPFLTRRGVRDGVGVVDRYR